MQTHEIVPKTKLMKKKRIGRGGKRGTFSGRGTKGLLARAGGKRRPEERDTLKRIPKLRGYRFKSFRAKPTIVHINRLEKIFANGDLVSPDTLVRAGLVKKSADKTPRIKILNRGALVSEISGKKFVFKGVTFSRSVVEHTNAVNVEKKKGV